VSGLAEMMEAVAASLDPLTLEVTGLQITAFLNPAPTPPSIDVYPAAVSGVPISFQGGWEETVTVRARVTTPDDTAGQQVLLRLMDVDGPSSVIAALKTDSRFAIDERSGYQAYPGDYLGCEWTVRWVQ
jgi:hypothetical protein